MFSSPAGLKDGAVTNLKVATAAAIACTKLGVGTLRRVATATVSGGAVTSITFTGLDLETDKAYYIKCMIITPNLGGTSSMALYFNNDQTATNYYTETIMANAGGISAAGTNNSIFAYIGRNTGADFNLSHAIISKVAGAYEPCTIGGSMEGRVLFCEHAIRWVTTDNITRLDFVAAVANAIDNGSIIEIYKVD